VTALCGGGTSSIKPGTAGSVILSSSAVSSLLSLLPIPWMLRIAAYIGTLSLDLTTLCASDPPAAPAISAIDVANLLLVGQPLLQLPAAAKFVQVIEHYAWCYFCQCDNGTIPDCGALPAEPIGSPVLNPVQLPPASTAQPCLTYTTSHTIPAGTSTFTTTRLPLPSGCNYVVIDTVSALPDPGAGHTYAANVNTYVGTGLDGFQPVVGWVAAGTHIRPHAEGAPFSPTVDHFDITFAGNSIPTAVPLEVTVNFYCGTRPTGGGSSITPCPPDLVTQGLLDQILQLVQLIQRQAVAFATIDSTVHAGLSGEGHIDVQGLIGCRVLLTTIPSNVGIENSDPLTYWDAGWIRWSNSDGAGDRIWISASPFVSLPPQAGQYTRIGYTLGPGVVATITEIRREA
jgi:hypothetical protein